MTVYIAQNFLAFTGWCFTPHLLHLTVASQVGIESGGACNIEVFPCVLLD